MGKILSCKKISFLTAFLCVVTLVAAQEFTVDNIKYKILDSVNKTVRIIDGKSTTGNLVIPQTVVSNSKTYTVKEIGNNAFEGNKNITSVDIPASVDSIGVYAFYECEEVNEYDLKEGLKTIGNGAFNGAKKVISFKIPASVVHIGEQVFIYTESLTRFVVAPANTNYTVDDDILYNKSKTEIIKYPCKKNGDTYTIPNTVKIIKSVAMEGCSRLKNIIFSTGIDSIEDGAFLNCLRIEQLDLPAGLKKIGNEAFASCLKLHTVNIPASVEKIGRAPFFMSGNLEIINVAAENTKYSSENGVLFNKDKSTLIIYPNGKTNGSYTVASTVTTIEERAFAMNNKLKNIELPASLTKINTAGFFACNGLQQIICKSTTPPELGNQVFGAIHNISKVVLKVPASAVSAYKAANEWKKFKIESESTTSCNPVENSTYKIYPTHTEGTIFVVAHNSAKAIIYNMYGQTVKTVEIEQGENSIDISEQPAGSYIVRIGENIFKIIKK